MAHQDGVGHIHTRHGLMQGIVKHRCAAAQALLQHQVPVPQGLLEQAGPAFVLVEAAAAVGAVGGVGAVAVGVGVAEADDMFFHWGSPLSD